MEIIKTDGFGITTQVLSYDNWMEKGYEESLLHTDVATKNISILATTADRVGIPVLNMGILIEVGKLFLSDISNKNVTDFAINTYCYITGADITRAERALEKYRTTI